MRTSNRNWRIWVGMAAVLLTAATWAFSSELTWDFSFDAADVELTPRGEYTILSLADGANPRDAIGAPAIPAKFANILLPDGATDVSVAATGDLVLLASDITPYPVQRVAPKSKPLPPFTAPDADAYASADPWPSAVATFEGVHEMQGSTFVSVRVNPLVYVASEKALYYRPIVSVTVSYATPSVAPRSSRSVSQNALATEMVNALVVNPEDADSPSAIRRRAAARASSVDYLIITSSGLSSAFQNLANYRATAAGGAFKTLVITTNEIASSYSGDDIQMKIRNCISNYVKSSGTTYVVLGGDDSVVPDRDCYGNVDNETYEWHMPTDLYYSDLTGTWKASGNTNFGVRAASVDMSPDVIVGRIPVRTAAQLSGYLAKVQAFEADTSHTRNSIIMGGPAAWCRYYANKRPSDDVTGDGHAGFRASTRPGYVSDSEMWNRRLFRDGIYTNWSRVESSITMKIACDSITSWDSSTCGDKALSSSNLKNWLNNGYTHFMFSGHGYPQGWGMETSGNYSTSQASSQTNLVAFVFTDACLTGAFDEDGVNSYGITVDIGTSDEYTYTSEPCLGEAFVRNASGGALVHMGCARYGWGTPDASSGTSAEDSDGYYTNYTATATSDGGPSTVYAYKFYKRLYESAAVASNRTLGAAFAMSKADMISECSSDGCERWIQYGLNYLGDPAITLYPRVIPDAAPEFSSSAASTNGCTGESIYFDFSELLVAGSPAPTYTVSTSVSSSLYEWADGILAFTPIATGTYTFTCTAANGISPNATCTLTVTVTPPPPETPSEVAVISSDSFTATWSPVTGASTYELVVLEGTASSGGSGPFTLVTSSSGLTAGEYVILADGIDRAMNNTYNSSYLSYEDVTVDNSTITTDDASIIWTLAGDASSCTLFNSDAQKYVNPATSKSVGWSADASGAWTLSLNNDLVTVANAANTDWMLQYNSGSPRFTCYNSAQKKLRFFRRNAGRALSRAVGDVVYSNSVGNVTNFSVTGLQPDTSYSYSVRAIVDGQPTAWSDSVSVTTTEGDAAPVWSASFPTTGSVTVGQDFEILDVASYVSGSPTPTVTLTSSSSSDADYENGYFLFNTLTPGEYPFTFTAANTVGTSNATITVTVSAAPITVPTLMVDDATDTTAYALWDACTGVSSYTLQLASDNQFTTGGSGGSVTLFSNDASTPTTVPTDWTYEIASVSSSKAFLVLYSGNYVITEAFDASACTNLSLSLYMRTYGGTAQPSVTVQYSTDGGTTWSTSLGTLSAANSTMAQRTLDVSDAIGAPSVRLRIASTSTSSSVGVGIQNIVLTGTESSGSGSLIATYTVNDTEYTFTSLTPNTTYFARVKGNDAWSNVEEFTTDSAGDSAPVWSTIPPISVTVGDVIPNFYPATYVSGSPAPTITLSQTTASSGEYEFDDGLLMFQPLTIGSFGFTFTANNGIGSPASATLTVNSTGSVPVVSVPQTSCSTSLGGADVDFYVTATGTPTPTLALSDTTATSGYDFDPDDGYFTFIPYATGTFTFTFTATSLAGSNSVTVTVTVTDAAVTVPTLTVTNVTDTTALATWTACDGVTSYTLQLATNDFPAASSAARSRTPILAEDFSGFTANGTTDISGSLNNYTTNGGWTGSKVYCNSGEAKVGASSGQAWLTTPALTVSGSLTVVWEARTYGTSDKYTLLLGISEDGENYTDTTITLYDDMTVYTNTLEVSGTTAYVRWMNSGTSKARFYLDNVTVTNPGGGDTPAGDDVQEFTVPGTSYEFTGLTPYTVYYARVKGNADWSSTEQFITDQSSASAPVLTVSETSYSVLVGDPDVSFSVTASGTPAPTVTATCTEGAYFVFEDGQFLFEANAVGTYHFVFTATNSEGSDSETVTIVVSAAPVTVPVLTVTNITDTTALATWTPCDDVSTYTLQLSTDFFPASSSASRDATTLLSESFEDGIPNTWSKSASNVTAASGKGGDGDGCVAFKAANVYLITPALSNPTGISFMYKRSSNTTAWELDVSVANSTDGPWTSIGTVTDAGTTWNTFTGTISLTGTVYVKFTDNRSSGSHERYIDLVQVTGTSGGGDDPGGDDIETYTVTGTSYTFSGLTPDSAYVARVKGNAAWSEEVLFETEAAAGSAPVVTVPQTSYSVTVGDPDVNFTVTATGTPAPTVTATCTEGAYFVFEDGQFLFEANTAGTYHFVFTATNSEGSDSKTVTVTVSGAAPSISVPQTSYAVTVGDPDVSFDVTATGAPAPTVTATCTEGAYFVFEDGQFLFEANTAGTYHFVFTATNSEGSATETVTVTVSAAPVTVPVLTVTNVTDTTALATWTACDGVTEYTLQLSTNDFPAASGTSARSATPILAEDFSGVNGAGSTAITNFDSVMGTNGWSGTFVYPFNGAVRLGKGSGAGSLQTPAIEVGETVRVAWSACWWTNDSTKIYVGVSTDNGTTFDETEVLLSDAMKAYTNNFTVTGSPAIVRWRSSAASNQRFFLDDIAITTFGDDPGGDGIQEFTVAGTSYEFTGLTPYTVYYARVKGNADWSSTEQFITDEAASTDVAPEFTSSTTASGVVGSEIEFTATATGTPEPTVTLTSSTADSAEYEVEGGYVVFTPSAVGIFTFTFTAENRAGSATQTITVTVTGSAPEFTSTTTASGVVGGEIEFTATATGTPEPTVTLTSSTADSAEYDDEGGYVYFTPTAAGTYTFTFTAVNAAGSATQTITVTVTGGDVPLTGYEAWVTGLGLDPAVYPATATGANGHLNSENYICDISPLSTVELELGVTGGQVDLAEGAKSANRSYTLQVWTDLKAAPVETDLGLGATGLPIALDDISATEFMRVKVTIP